MRTNFEPTTKRSTFRDDASEQKRSRTKKLGKIDRAAARNDKRHQANALAAPEAFETRKLKGA